MVQRSLEHFKTRGLKIDWHKGHLMHPKVHEFTNVPNVVNKEGMMDSTFQEISDRKKELQEKWNCVSR